MRRHELLEKKNAKKCPDCNGSGYEDGNTHGGDTCPTCKGSGESWNDKQNAKHVIPTGNAQVVYRIEGVPGETFEVTRDGTMLPKGKYVVVSKATPRMSNWSELTVERVNSSEKKNGGITAIGQPYKEGAWWYVDVNLGGGQVTKKKFGSEIEANNWLKSKGLENAKDDLAEELRELKLDLADAKRAGDKGLVADIQERIDGLSKKNNASSLKEEIAKEMYSKAYKDLNDSQKKKVDAEFLVAREGA